MFEAATTGTHRHSTMIYLLSWKSIATQEKSCSIAVVQPGGDHGVQDGTIQVLSLWIADVKLFSFCKLGIKIFLIKME